MTRVSAVDLCKNLDRWLVAVRDGPLEITVDGNVTAYLIPPELFRQRSDERKRDKADVEDATDIAIITGVIAGELGVFKGRVSEAFLFGSIVPGNVRRTARIDLMVVGDLTLLDLGEAMERIEAALGRLVNLNLFTPTAWRRLAGNRFIREILAENRIDLIES